MVMAQMLKKTNALRMVPGAKPAYDEGNRHLEQAVAVSGKASRQRAGVGVPDDCTLLRRSNQVNLRREESQRSRLALSIG